MDKPDLINFKLHLKKMRSNEDVLVEFEDLNEKNFNLPLQKYDKKHNSFFKSIEELNIAIELYKNQGLKNKVKKTNATQKRVKKNKNINKISTGNINSSRKYHTSTSIFNTYKKDFSITTTLDTINDEISEINNNDVIENLGDLGIAVTGKQSAISYLDMIRNVVQNSQLDPFKTQLYIEKSSIDFEKKKLEDEKYLLTTHGHILYKLIFEAKKTLEILYEKKELKLKFPTLNGELNKIEYLFLVFSLSITYYGRLD